MLPLLTALAPAPLEAMLYTTMPAFAVTRPEYAMDGDEKTLFRSYGSMERGDSFTVMLSRPAAVRNVRVLTGDAQGEDRLVGGIVEVSADGENYTALGTIGADGTLSAKPSGSVAALRIRTGRRAASHVAIREIRIEAPEAIDHALLGPGRGFTDLGGFNDLKGWADKAERQMESFWADTAALLYSEGLITPNAVNVEYRQGPNVTPVAATGGGVMTVNVDWCRKNPNDTGLAVHEMAHVVQSGTSPGWLTEAVADYIRWVKFEPQNFTPRIDPAKATPRDPYRNGATFLGWCELHYDRKLVTKLNDDARFGRYKDTLFDKYCGKSIDVLFKEFLADYQKDPKGVLTAPVPAALKPRTLPTVKTGSGVSITMPYDTIGIASDGTSTRENGGFDGEGSTYSGTALGRTVTTNGVTFRLGPVGVSNVLAARGQTVRLTGSHRSLWVLASAIQGGQRDETLTVTYADGSTARLDQNFSDWYAPEGFPGEVRAVRMPYRNLANGSRDDRPFNLYAYGFALDGTKPLRSVTLPNNENIRILGLSVAD